MSPDELVKKKFDGGLHLATHIHYRKTLRVPDSSATTAADCAATAPNSFNDASTTAGDAKTTFGNGICKYSSAQNLLPLGIEGMNFNIIPGYDTTSKNYAGVKPKTYVRRKGEDADLYTFEAGSNIALDVAQLMDLAGLDLDKTWDQQPNGFTPSDSEKGYGTSASAYPTVRLTGSRIMIDIKYYNYELDDVTSTEIGTDDVYAIVEVSGKVQWESRGQSITYRTEYDNWASPFNKDGQPNGAFEDFYVYGINIDVTSSGVVAKFDIMLFINTVIPRSSCSAPPSPSATSSPPNSSESSPSSSPSLCARRLTWSASARVSRCRPSSPRTSSSRRTSTAVVTSTSRRFSRCSTAPSARRLSPSPPRASTPRTRSTRSS